MTRRALRWAGRAVLAALALGLVLFALSVARWVLSGAEYQGDFERFRVRHAAMAARPDGRFTLTLDIANRADPFWGWELSVEAPEGITAEVVARDIPWDRDRDAHDWGTVVYTVALSPRPAPGETLSMTLHSDVWRDGFSVIAP